MKGLIDHRIFFKLVSLHLLGTCDVAFAKGITTYQDEVNFGCELATTDAHKRQYGLDHAAQMRGAPLV